MKQSKNESNSAKTVWKRTKVQNLLRNSESGKYYARFKVGGKQKWLTLKTDVYSVAKLRLSDVIKRERQRLERVNARDVGRMTVEDAIASYRAMVEVDPNLRPGSIKARIDAIQKIRKSWPELSRMDVRKVTTIHCRKWASCYLKNGTGFTPPGSLRAIPKGASASSFNKAKDTLRRLFDIAVEAGAIYENPVRGIKRAREKPKELRLPSGKQFFLFVKEIAESGAPQARDCADLVKFLAFSGCRIREARLLTWRDIDFDSGQVRVYGEKTDDYRTFPMVAALRQLLERMRAEREFDSLNSRVLRIRECQKSMTRAAGVIGIERITHHDLRHLFITRCIESGVDIPTISRWIGHKDGGALLMRRYGHLRDEHSLAAARKVSFDKGDLSEKVVGFQERSG